MKRLIHSISILAILVFLGTACSVKQADMDVEKVKEEINSRKIRRVTDAQIVQAAYDSGKAIIERVDISQATCNESLNIDNDLVVSCMLVCDSTFLEATKEQQVWSAYKYNFENGLEMNDNIQKSADSLLLYTLPVTELDTAQVQNIKLPRVLFLRLSKKDLILKM